MNENFLISPTAMMQYVKEYKINPRFKIGDVIAYQCDHYHVKSEKIRAIHVYIGENQMEIRYVMDDNAIVEQDRCFVSENDFYEEQKRVCKLEYERKIAIWDEKISNSKHYDQDEQI